jgi:hypothetical protein
MVFYIQGIDVKNGGFLSNSVAIGKTKPISLHNAPF